MKTVMRPAGVRGSKPVREWLPEDWKAATTALVLAARHASAFHARSGHRPRRGGGAAAISAKGVLNRVPRASSQLMCRLRGSSTLPTLWSILNSEVWHDDTTGTHAACVPPWVRGARGLRCGRSRRIGSEIRCQPSRATAPFTTTWCEQNRAGLGAGTFRSLVSIPQ
jgi:hypothetical protein